MTSIPAISNSNRVLDATATAGQSEFAISWPVIADSEAAAGSDMVVLVDGTALAPAVYSFSGVAISGVGGIWNGGTLTLNTPLSGGQRVVIYSARTPRRTGYYLEGKSLPFTELDKLMDDYAVQMRDMRLDIDRSFKVTVPDLLDGVDPTDVVGSVTDLTTRAEAAEAGAIAAAASVSITEASNVNPKLHGAYGDGVSRQITTQDITDHAASWIGVYTAGTEWDAVGVQEAIYAAFAPSSTPGHVVWNAVSGSAITNKKLWNPRGNYLLNRQILMVASGFVFEFENRLGTTWTWTGDKNTTMFLCDSASYGEFNRVHLTSAVVMDAPLWDLDWTGTHASLKTQQLSINNPQLDGAFLCLHGLRISHSGGSAQGDTIEINNPISSSFLRDWLRAEGGNALDINVFLGDVQGCCWDGICAAPGAVKVWGLHGENQAIFYNFWPAYNQIANDGASVHIIGAPGGNPSDIRGMREEGDIPIRAENGAPCRADEVAALGASSVVLSRGTAYHPGHPLYGSTIGTKYKTFMCVSMGQVASMNHPDSKSGKVFSWTLSQGWTPGAFVGKTAYYRFPAGFTSHYGVTANTDRTITLDTDPGTMSAGVMVAIGGVSDPSSAPDFDTCPKGYSTYRGAVSHGFQYTLGDSHVGVDATIYANINVNDWVAIPQAAHFLTPDSTVRDWTCCHFAKVSGKSGGNQITLTTYPSYNLTDAFGYYGGTLADGDILWMEIDFDVITGVSKGDQIYTPYGRTRYCGEMHIATFRTDKDVFSRSDVRNSVGVDGSLRLMSAPRLLNPTALGTQSGTISLSATMGQCDCASVTIGGDTTFNAPLPVPGVMQDFTLHILTSGASSRTITFGSNFRSSGTLATGTADAKKFVVRFQSDGTTWNEVVRSAAL